MGQKINRQAQSTDSFSTTETDTGKKWIDGRTIYRKVLQGNLTVAVGSNAVAHGISGLTTGSEFVSLFHTFRLSTTTRGASVNTSWHRETGGNWINPTAIDGTQVTFTSSFAWGASAYTIILEYVK